MRNQSKLIAELAKTKPRSLPRDRLASFNTAQLDSQGYLILWSKMTPPLIVPAVRTSRHTATVIFVHGLGDSGGGWIDLAENWRRRSKFNEVKFVFPNAPNIPITVVGRHLDLQYR